MHENLLERRCEATGHACHALHDQSSSVLQYSHAFHNALETKSCVLQFGCILEK